MMMWLPSLQSWATCEQAIRKFLLPIRVMPSSFSLPRLIVTPSRIVLPSPMIDLRVAAGVTDVLRLAADHDVGINHVVAADRDVADHRDASSSAACRARIRTWGPIVENGPISTSSSISAWGSTARVLRNASRHP